MRSVGSLTDGQIKSAKPQEKPYKLFDQGGLYVQVSTAGGKHWKLKYRVHGREHLSSLGRYPDVSLGRARVLASEQRVLIQDGIRPIEHRRQAEAAAAKARESTFGVIASLWIAANEQRWSVSYRRQVRAVMQSHVIGNASLASTPISEVSTAELRLLLQSIARRTTLKEGERKPEGSVAIARLVRSHCQGVFSFAIERELVSTDPMAQLRYLTELRRPAMLVKQNTKLNPSELAHLARRIRTNGGTRMTALALEMLMLTFVRTGELRGAMWDEFDMQARLWRIPASRMKARREHVVPLARQMLEALEELRTITGDNRYLFPNQRDSNRCMNATTLNRVLERMGLNGPNTLGFSAHGFRGTAATMLNEEGQEAHIVDLQLAHSPTNKVAAIYNAAKHLKQREGMMQAWADRVDQLRDNGWLSP